MNDHHEKDEAVADMYVSKLPGLHGQPSQVSMDGGVTEDGSLPPIANMSLGKANMAGNQTARRGYYDQQYAAAKNKPVAGVAAAMSKRQSMGQVAVGAGGAPVVPGLPKYQVSPHKAEASSSFKYKANNPKPSSKYISPYSLRQLAGKE